MRSSMSAKPSRSKSSPVMPRSILPWPSSPRDLAGGKQRDLDVVASLHIGAVAPVVTRLHDAEPGLGQAFQRGLL